MTTPTVEEKFIEAGAALEHARWAKWQNYLHSFLTWNNDIQAWILPHEKKDHWQMQINTPYAMLSEQEKESDRKEVREYLPLLRAYGTARYEEGVKAEQERVREWAQDYGTYTDGNLREMGRADACRQLLVVLSDNK